MSRETLLLLAELLNGQQLPVGHPDFESAVQRFIVAKRELAEALAATEDSA